VWDRFAFTGIGAGYVLNKSASLAAATNGGAGRGLLTECWNLAHFGEKKGKRLTPIFSYFLGKVYILRPLPGADVAVRH
jgi:hypothetical protein